MDSLDSPFVLILDELQASGEFLMLHLLKSSLASNQRVLLASFNSLERTKSRMKKLGVTNLQASLDASSLHYIDLCILLSPSSPPSTPLNLKAAYQCIQEAMTLLDLTMLIIDNLSTLRSLSTSSAGRNDDKDWLSFIHLLSCIPTSQGISSNRRLVLLAHGDIDDDGPWLVSLEHRATQTVRVSSLGFELADVDGKVVIKQRVARGGSCWGTRDQELGGPGLSQLPLEASRTLWFKSSETTMGGVKWLTDLNQTF